MEKGVDFEVPTLEALIGNLHEAFADDEVDIDYVKNLMFSYKSNLKEWKKFAKFDRYRYTRNLVDEGNGKFNLMLLCWGPSHQSTLHDHSESHCFMKMMEGCLEESRYDWPSGEEAAEMTEMSQTVLKLNEVCYIHDSLGLHRVSNVSHTEGAVSLHLYSPPFDQCQIFDERSGRKSKCKVTFYSRNGVKCNKKEDAEECVH